MLAAIPVVSTNPSLKCFQALIVPEYKNLPTPGDKPFGSFSFDIFAESYEQAETIADIRYEGVVARDPSNPWFEMICEWLSEDNLTVEGNIEALDFAELVRDPDGDEEFDKTIYEVGAVQDLGSITTSYRVCASSPEEAVELAKQMADMGALPIHLDDILKGIRGVDLDGLHVSDYATEENNG